MRSGKPRRRNPKLHVSWPGVLSDCHRKGRWSWLGLCLHHKENCYCKLDNFSSDLSTTVETRLVNAYIYWAVLLLPCQNLFKTLISHPLKGPIINRMKKQKHLKSQKLWLCPRTHSNYSAGEYCRKELVQMLSSLLGKIDRLYLLSSPYSNTGWDRKELFWNFCWCKVRRSISAISASHSTADPLEICSGESPSPLEHIFRSLKNSSRTQHKPTLYCIWAGHDGMPFRAKAALYKPMNIRPWIHPLHTVCHLDHCDRQHLTRVLA